VANIWYCEWRWKASDIFTQVIAWFVWYNKQLFLAHYIAQVDFLMGMLRVYCEVRTETLRIIQDELHALVLIINVVSEDRVRCRANICKILRINLHWERSSQISSVFPCQCHSTNAQYWTVLILTLTKRKKLGSSGKKQCPLKYRKAFYRKKNSVFFLWASSSNFSEFSKQCTAYVEFTGTNNYVVRSEPTEKFERKSFHVNDCSQTVFLRLLLLHRHLHPHVIHMVQTINCDIFLVCVNVTCKSYVICLVQNL